IRPGLALITPPPLTSSSLISSSLILSCSLFFFSCYGAHRDLHSFPTRRSSDLVNLFLRRSTPMCNENKDTARKEESHAEVTDSRSEEHTSELQSRFDLVCRLLLEKKKKDDK